MQMKIGKNMKNNFPLNTSTYRKIVVIDTIAEVEANLEDEIAYKCLSSNSE